MNQPLTRRPHRRRTLAALAAVLAAVTLSFTAPAVAEDDPNPGSDDPSLRQTIDPDQRVATGQVELDAGHVDIGPRYTDKTWTLMVHDDSNVKGSVWRPLNDTVFRVGDTSTQTVPDDPAYEFLGVPADSKVHVIPQTQQQDVVWVGWNTQEPGVLAAIDRGATLTLEGVQGPGDLVVYLQSGAFGEPDVLWDSRKTAAQDLYVDINTHTHANWVFTKPGVYLVKVKASANLVDQSTVADTQVIRFAVGNATKTADAHAAIYTASTPVQDQPETTETASDTSSTADGGDGPDLWPIVLGAAAVLLILAVTVTAVRGKRARAGSREEDQT